ncbi:hypothetical protein QFC20_003071 [Naganishia adeliensis]|uniref:Uncharacterized protein n=1 Tax=Naganishia adeliensis TaxID=92952 RepID=A0ACC2WHI4_9TREE|nr:hypothetical protein QFC20_003071 [Naganishia adeliensis]
MSRPIDFLDTIGINNDGPSALFQSGITDTSNRLPEYRSPDDMCPICKTDRYSKPGLRLLISPCYHKLCERCVEHLFSLGAGKCPHEGCGRVLRRTNFIHQTFEDLGVEREVGVRGRVAQVFNKSRDDFATEREYNDYLEMVEDITFNLINDIDRAETERRITEYTTRNASQITTNVNRAREESIRQSALDSEFRRTRELNALRAREEEAREAEEQKNLKQSAFEDIRNGGTGEGEYKRLERRKAGSAPAPIKPVASGAQPRGNEHTTPLSPSYAGPYAAFPYSAPPAELVELELHDPPTVDAQRKAHGGDLERVCAGGWVVEEIWERDRRWARESLWVS